MAHILCSPTCFGERMLPPLSPLMSCSHFCYYGSNKKVIVLLRPVEIPGPGSDFLPFRRPLHILMLDCLFSLPSSSCLHFCYNGIRKIISVLLRHQPVQTLFFPRPLHILCSQMRFLTKAACNSITMVSLKWKITVLLRLDWNIQPGSSDCLPLRDHFMYLICSPLVQIEFLLKLLSKCATIVKGYNSVTGTSWD